MKIIQLHNDVAKRIATRWKCSINGSRIGCDMFLCMQRFDMVCYKSDIIERCLCVRCDERWYDTLIYWTSWVITSLQTNKRANERSSNGALHKDRRTSRWNGNYQSHTTTATSKYLISMTHRNGNISVFVDFTQTHTIFNLKMHFSLLHIWLDIYAVYRRFIEIKLFVFSPLICTLMFFVWFRFLFNHFYHEIGWSFEQQQRQKMNDGWSKWRKRDFVWDTMIFGNAFSSSTPFGHWIVPHVELPMIYA